MKQQESRPEAIGKTGASVPQSESELATPSTAGTATGQKEQPGKWVVMATVAIGVFMATLDSSIVNITHRCYLASPYHTPSPYQYTLSRLPPAPEWLPCRCLRPGGIVYH